MGPGPPLDPERLFAGEPGVIEVYRAVRTMVDRIGPTEIRATRSKVAFRRRRGLAFLWLPVSWAAERTCWSCSLEPGHPPRARTRALRQRLSGRRSVRCGAMLDGWGTPGIGTIGGWRVAQQEAHP